MQLKFSPSSNASTQIAHSDPISIVLQIDIFNPSTPAVSRLGKKTRNKKIVKKNFSFVPIRVAFVAELAEAR